MKIRSLLLITLCTLATAAQAHPGVEGLLHAHSVFLAAAAGFMHPLTGWDHVLAMLSLGLWCGLLLQRQWLPPLTFVACMALGLALTQIGVTLPVVEPMVAVSLLVFGLLLFAQAHLPVAWAMALAALFALFHGYAHGEVFPPALPGQVFVAYMAGMVAASLLLHALGVLAGRWLRRQPNRAHDWAGRLLGVVALAYGAIALGA